MKIDISVIIPAYNAENTIRRAVESVRNQHLLSYEILIVENGSTDHTFRICKDMEAEDASIRVLQSEKGVSRARNKGIEEATGDWICFVDADDYLYSKAFETAAGQLNKDVDLLCFRHNSLNDTGDTTANIDVTYAGSKQCEQCRIGMLMNPTRYMPVWGKLFRRQIIVAHQLRFDEALSYAEDSDFTIRYTRHCTHIIFLKNELYHYTIDNGSTVRSYKSGIADKYLLALNHSFEQIKAETEEIQKAYNRYVLMHLLLILVHDTYASQNKSSGRDKRNCLKKLLNEDIIAHAMQSVSVKDLSDMRMLPIFLLRHRCYFPAELIVKMRVRQNERKMTK